MVTFNSAAFLCVVLDYIPRIFICAEFGGKEKWLAARHIIAAVYGIRKRGKKGSDKNGLMCDVSYVKIKKG